MLRKIAFWSTAIFVSFVSAVSIADLSVKDGGGVDRVIKNFVCETTKLCNATVLIKSDGTELGTASQPVRTDPTGTTTQPVSAASLPLPSGAATSANQSTTNTSVGATNESAAGSDTATSGLNGLIKRLLQSITTLNGKIDTLNTNVTAAIPAGTNEIGGVNVTKFAGTAAAVNSGNKDAGTQRVVLATDQPTMTNPQPVTPAATESHLGEVGGNQIRVDVAQTVTASSAYTSGNAIGGKMTIAGAARVSGSLGAAGTGGILQQVVANSKSVQTAQIDVFIFNSDPSSSTCTDKTAFVLATADFDKVIGVASIPGTPANNSGWFSGGTGSVGQANNLAMAFDLASSTTLYACAVVRGAPTFTATSDISFKYQFLRN